nr:unnamed protein product [Digitaria exilis]
MVWIVYFDQDQPAPSACLTDGHIGAGAAAVVYIQLAKGNNFVQSRKGAAGSGWEAKLGQNWRLARFPVLNRSETEERHLIREMVHLTHQRSGQLGMRRSCLRPWEIPRVAVGAYFTINYESFCYHKTFSPNLTA